MADQHKSNVRIESDGTVSGTKVYVGGVQLTNVAKIEIEPIEPDAVVTATVKVYFPDLKIDMKEVKFDASWPQSLNAIQAQ